MQGPLWARWEFWVAMVFAVAMKLRASRKISLWVGVASVVGAVAGALIFTDPLVQYWQVPGDWRYAAAALVALTAEHGARLLAEGRIGEFLDMLRGKRPPGGGQ
jgi:uncharacterized membrane protein YedE/YeeE